MQNRHAISIVRAIDGDTVVGTIHLPFGVSVEKVIRLLGVDTPEMHATDPALREKAKLAKQFSEDRTRHVAGVMLDSDGKTDKYGRTLGKVILPGGMDLAEALIQAGHGRFLKGVDNAP